MADKKISELTTLTGVNVQNSADYLAIVDGSAVETKKISRAELVKGLSAITFVNESAKVSTAENLTVLISFDTIADAEAGETGTCKFIWVNGLLYVYDAAGTDLTTADSRTWTISETEFAGLRPYSSRSAFISATILAVVTKHFWLTTSGRIVSVVRNATGPITQSNGQKWAPAEIVSPEHFAENTIPGTTAMDSAIQDAADWLVENSTGNFTNGTAGEIQFIETEYQINNSVLLDDNYDYIRFTTSASSIIRSSVSGPVFQVGASVLFGGGDTAGALSVYGVEFHGLRFLANDASATDTIAIRSGKAPDLKIINCEFISFYISIDWHRQNTPEVTGCRFSSSGRTSAAPARTHLLVQGVYDSTNSHTPGGGAHIGSNEFLGSPSDVDALLSCIEIKAADGFYFEGANHFNYYSTAGLLISPDGTLQNNKITDIENRGTMYHDGLGGATSRAVSVTGTVSYGGAAGDGMLQRIRLDQIYIRGGGTVNNGVVFSVTDGGGFIAQYGGIKDVSICHGDLRQFKTTCITLNGTTLTRIPLVNPMIHSNKFGDGRKGGTTGGTSYVFADVDGISFIGNIFDTEENAPSQSVHINCSSYSNSSVIFIGNDFSKSIASSEPFLFTFSNSTIKDVVGNLIPGGLDIGYPREVKVTVADDAVGLVKLPRGRYGVIAAVMCDASVSDVQNSHSGLVRVDAGGSPSISSINAGSNFSTSTSTLTGTTGTDGNTTVAPNSSQQIQIENRSGSSRTYSISFL